MLSEIWASKWYNVPQSVLIFHYSCVANGEKYQLCLFLVHSNRRTWRAMWALQIFPTKFTENQWREVLSSHSWLWVSNSFLAPFYIPVSPQSVPQSCFHLRITNTIGVTVSQFVCLFKWVGFNRYWYIYIHKSMSVLECVVHSSFYCACSCVEDTWASLKLCCWKR